MEKRLFRLFALILALCVLAACFAAAEEFPGLPEQLDEDAETTADAEPADPEAAGDLGALFGEGEAMQIDLMSAYDTVGARYVFLGYKSLHRGLAALVRTTEKDVICWEMERTKENLEKARQFLSADAPMISAASFEDKKISQSAMYLRDAEGSSFDAFLAEAEKVFSSLPVSRPLAEASADDPLLKEFTGISWDMTAKELKEKFRKGMMLGSGSSLVSRQNSMLYGTVTYTISTEDDRISRIIVTVTGGTDMLKLSFRNKYGKETVSMFTYAMAGAPKADPAGDTLVWTSGDTLICMHGGTIHYLHYYP